MKTPSPIRPRLMTDITSFYLGSLQHVWLFLQRVVQSFLWGEPDPAEPSVEARFLILEQHEGHSQTHFAPAASSASPKTKLMMSMIRTGWRLTNGRRHFFTEPNCPKYSLISSESKQEQLMSLTHIQKDQEVDMRSCDVMSRDATNESSPGRDLPPLCVHLE